VNDIKTEIKNASIASVVAEAGVALKTGGGGRLVGLCPLHKEKTPSFTVYPDKNTFYCFGCGVGGDAAEFVMKVYGVEFLDALRKLGISNDQSGFAKSPMRVPRVKQDKNEKDDDSCAVSGHPGKLWIEKATKFADWCHAKLLENDDQLAWLGARGIDAAAIKKHRLGWNPGESDEKPQFFRHRHSWGLPDEIKPNGKKKMLWLPRGIVIPLVKNEKVLRLRIRADKPRYYVVPGSAMDIMVIRGDHRCMVVVESELDAILLDTVAGDLAGYMALGTALKKPDCMADYCLTHASYIILSLDYDDAGKKALNWWAEHYPRANVWPLPAGKDPGDAFQDGVDLREWILAAYPAGWHIQRQVKKRRRPEKTPPIEKNDRTDFIPEPVVELAGLMKNAPVSVIVTDDQLKIMSPVEWNYKNWERLGRISQLVYFTPNVSDYLYDCGKPKLTWRDIER